MEIKFTTQEESNQERQEAFLALSPHERFVAFLRLQEPMLQFPTHKKPKYKGNFVIKFHKND